MDDRSNPTQADPSGPSSRSSRTSGGSLIGGDSRIWRPTRRELLGAGGVLLVGGTTAVAMRQWARNERGLRADVLIAKATSYGDGLTETIADGLNELGVDRRLIRGKKVLLKPNLVETAVDQHHINTHPSAVVAAAEVFRRLDASEVVVAEGQGHRRDSELVLDESGMGAALRAARLPFVDLNHDDPVTVPNRGEWTQLGSLHLPRTVLQADIIVSLPKLKTHHWAGVTCSMKNFFGVMPGTMYGWPKNVLHFNGIPECILDINATVRPTLSIVDAVIGMEGDGPIMGAAKQVGCLIMGTNLPAVDATATRLMDLDPSGVAYLVKASGKLGPVHAHNITQRGERIESLQTPFRVLDVPHLAGLRKPHSV